MKVLFWVVLVAFVGVLGYVAYDVVFRRTPRARPVQVSSDVGPESIQAYRERVEQLRMKAEDMKRRMQAAGTLDRPDVTERLLRFEQEAGQLELAIRRWGSSLDRAGKNEAYRQCIMLYGRASGVCDALAPDTLKGK
jgi:Flp pilus assembly protein CpaB